MMMRLLFAFVLPTQPRRFISLSATGLTRALASQTTHLLDDDESDDEDDEDAAAAAAASKVGHRSARVSRWCTVLLPVINSYGGLE